MYRIKDELYYSVNIQEFDGEEWKPYKVRMRSEGSSPGRRRSDRIRDAEPLRAKDALLQRDQRQRRLLHCFSFPRTLIR